MLGCCVNFVDVCIGHGCHGCVLVINSGILSVKFTMHVQRGLIRMIGTKNGTPTSHRNSESEAAV